MLVNLQKRATTPQKVKTAVQARDGPASRQAEQSCTTAETVYKRPHRDGVEDRSHTPKRLETTLAPTQEALALRRKLPLSLDDLQAVVREFMNPDASSSNLGLCLWQHWIVNLHNRKAKAPQPKCSAFKAYMSGYINLDVNYLPQIEDKILRRYLFIVNDRVIRWVFIWIFKTKTTTNEWCFMRDLQRVCPMRSGKVPSAKGKEFEGYLIGLSRLAATGEQAFNTPSAPLEIQQNLTTLKSPQSEPLSAIW